MSDPAVIYLQPACCADPDTGRMWCDDDAPVDCEEGALWTKYVLAADAEAAIERAVRVALEMAFPGVILSNTPPVADVLARLREER